MKKLYYRIKAAIMVLYCKDVVVFGSKDLDGRGYVRHITYFFGEGKAELEKGLKFILNKEDNDIRN